MRELTNMEIDYVAGASFSSRLGAVIVGGVLGVTTGAYKGVVTGGSVGGVVGAGVISGAFGCVIGAGLGLIAGSLSGLINDYDYTVAQFNDTMSQFFDLSQAAPKV